MNRKIRILLSAFLLLVVLGGVPVLLTWRAVRQERLDKALITSIKANDTQTVLSLLQQGADANAWDAPKETGAFWSWMPNRLTGNSRQTSEQGPTALPILLTIRPKPTRIRYIGHNRRIGPPGRKKE